MSSRQVENEFPALSLFKNLTGCSVRLWALPGVRMLRQAELGIVLEDYPSDFIDPEHRYGVGEKESGIRAAVGTYFDEWGCPFEIGEPGVNGELKEPFSCFVQIRRVVPGGSVAVNREPPVV